jgi:hypothetical protein
MTRRKTVKRKTDAVGLRGLMTPGVNEPGLNLDSQRRSTNFVDVGDSTNPRRRTVNIETRPRSTRRAPGTVVGRDVGRRGTQR